MKAGDTRIACPKSEVTKMAVKSVTFSLEADDYKRLEEIVGKGLFASLDEAIIEAVKTMLRERYSDPKETDADRAFKEALFGLRGTVDPDFDFGIWGLDRRKGGERPSLRREPKLARRVGLTFIAFFRQSAPSPSARTHVSRVQQFIVDAQRMS